MRKNIPVLALLFCGGFSLAAQSRPDLSFYVTPVTGRGSKPEDNVLFYNQLVLELTSQEYNLAETYKDADFSLIAALATDYEGQFVFQLELRDNRTGELGIEGVISYESPDEVHQQLPVLLATLLLTIPLGTDPAAEAPAAPGPPATSPAAPIPVAPKDVEWRNRFLYVGLAAKWTPGLYALKSGPDFNLFVGQIGISAEFHLLNFLSLETGAELGIDTVSISDKSYSGIILQFPLLLKFVIKPGTQLMLEPYGVAYVNIPWNQIVNQPVIINPAQLSVGLGFQFGVKAGPGVFFADLAVATDLGNSEANKVSFHRYFAHLGLGYKYGLFQRKIK